MDSVSQGRNRLEFYRHRIALELTEWLVSENTLSHCGLIGIVGTLYLTATAPMASNFQMLWGLADRCIDRNKSSYF